MNAFLFASVNSFFARKTVKILSTFFLSEMKHKINAKVSYLHLNLIIGFFLDFRILSEIIDCHIQHCLNGQDSIEKELENETSIAINSSLLL